MVRGVVCALRCFGRPGLERGFGVSLRGTSGGSARALGAGVILMRLADEAEVVPGLVEVGVGVDGALELTCSCDEGKWRLRLHHYTRGM